MPTEKMTPLERRGSLSLAIVLSLRMFGLFLILPVFTLYAAGLDGATPMLVGISFGAYGLTQALLQIPFGIVSDKFGRKIVIVTGLAIFAIGSLIAAVADSIWLMIGGRALQGAGAISAALMALAADLTRSEQRTKTMALIGSGIGVAFLLAFVIAPPLSDRIGGAGLFVVSAVFAVIAMAVLYTLTPTPARHEFHYDTETSPAMLLSVVKHAELLKLYFGIFALHAVLMANFIVIPVALQDYAGMAVRDHWQVYLPTLLVSALVVVPLIMGKRASCTTTHPKILVALLCLSQAGFAICHDTLVALMGFLAVFFTAFNYLEASLPARITSVVRGSHKGTALGVYATSQFIGTFTGGLIGGIIYGVFGMTAVFGFGATLGFIWWMIVLCTPLGTNLQLSRSETSSNRRQLNHGERS